LNPNVPDVQQTVRYGRERVSRRLLATGLAMLLGGVAMEILRDDVDRARNVAWLVMILGGGVAAYGLHMSLAPGRPLLELSPAGIYFRMIGPRHFLVPWAEIQDLDRIDITAMAIRGGSVTYKDVTVLVVSQRFFDRFVAVPWMVRGRTWDTFFVPRGSMMQIALHHDMLPVEPEEFRAAVHSRWYAFRDQPRGALPREDPGNETRLRTAWVLTVCVIAVGVLGLGGFFVHRAGLLKPSHRDDWARMQREQADLERRQKQFDEDMRRKFSEPRGWFTDDESRRDTPASTPAALGPSATPVPGPGHSNAVGWLAVTADGQSFLSAGSDHRVKLWDIADTRVSRDLGVHRGIVRAVHVLPDGTALSAGDDGLIVLRALKDGEVLHVFEAPEHGGVRALAVSPDARRAVSMHHGTGGGAVWDLEKRVRMHVLADSEMRQDAVAISPDGAHAVGGGFDGVLRIWDVGSGALERTFWSHRSAIYGVAWSPDGRHVVSASGDRTLRLWSLDSGTALTSFSGHSHTVYAVTLSRDGKQVLSGSLDGSARLWATDSGQEIMKFEGHTGSVYAVTFTPDGSILTGSSDGRIRLFRPNGQTVRVFPGTQATR
jgi:hypothetical protein